MQMLRARRPAAARDRDAKVAGERRAIVAATGGSTNAALHMPAIANEAGIAFTLDDVGEVFARTPLIGNLRPGGKYTAKDVYDIGGAAVVIRALIESGHIDGALPDGHRPDASPKNMARRTRPTARSFSVPATPIMPDGGVAVLKGNLCPDGAVIKVAGLKNLVFEGAARVFEDEEALRRRRPQPRLRAQARFWSSAMKARSAVPACARCSASPR